MYELEVNSLMGCKAEGHGARPPQTMALCVKWRWCVCRRKFADFFGPWLLIPASKFGACSAWIFNTTIPRIRNFGQCTSFLWINPSFLISKVREIPPPKQILPSLQCKHSFLPTQLPSSNIYPQKIKNPLSSMKVVSKASLGWDSAKTKKKTPTSPKLCSYSMVFKTKFFFSTII